MEEKQKNTKEPKKTVNHKNPKKTTPHQSAAPTAVSVRADHRPPDDVRPRGEAKEKSLPLEGKVAAPKVMTDEVSAKAERHRRRMRQQRLYTFIATLVLLVVLGALSAGCWFLYAKVFHGEDAPAAEQTDETPQDRETRIHTRIGEILAEMSLSDKAAAVLMVTPEQLTGADMVKEDSEQLKAALQSYPVAGLLFDESNFSTARGLKNLLTAIKTESRYPLFLALDECGGEDGSALATLLEEPLMSSPAFIGTAEDVNEARYAGTQIGRYMHSTGFNLNLSALAHVSAIPADPRCYSMETDVTAQLYPAFLEGAKENGLLSAAGVFPAPGAQDPGGNPEDNTLDATLEDLQTAQFLPFQAAIDAGAGIVMVGNVQAVRATGDNTPCSLSESMITGQLRGNLGFQGIVMAGRFDRDVITAGYTADAAAVNALLAGADIIVCPADFISAHRGIMEALDTGVLTEERLDRSITRIYRVLLELE